LAPNDDKKLYISSNATKFISDKKLDINLLLKEINLQNLQF